MSRTFKQPPKQNLLSVPVLIEDKASFSDYFEINDLNRIFSSGRNGFLIRGSEYLRTGTTIDVEILDRFGNPIYLTPVQGYSEGGARLISVEIYQETIRGPGTLVILGEAERYSDGRVVPGPWRGRKNVRWSTPIQIEPNNDNRTRIRLANDPTATVTEDNFSITRIDRTEVNVSAYTASLTYDYEVQKSDGYAIKMVTSSGTPTPFFSDDRLDGRFTGSITRRIVDRLYVGGVLTATSSIRDPIRSASVNLSLDKVLNETTAITQDTIQFNGEDFPTTQLRSGSFIFVESQWSDSGSRVWKRQQEFTSSVVFNYISENVTLTASTSSIITFRIPFVQTNTGEIYKVRVSAKEANDNISGYQLFAEYEPDEANLLVTGSATGSVGIGYFLRDSILQNNWHAGRFLVNGNFNRTDFEATESVTYPHTLIRTSTKVLEGAKVDNTSSSDSYFFGPKVPLQLYSDVEYTLRYTAVYSPTYVSGATTFSTTQKGDLDVYLARIGSSVAQRSQSAVVVNTDNPYGYQVDEINTKTNDKSLYEREVNFYVPKNGQTHLRFVSNAGFWSFGNIEIFPAVEKGFNPDEINFEVENRILVSSTNVFKIQFLNWNDEPISYEIITGPTFISGARDPGIDGFTVELSNPNFSFPADDTGAVVSYQGGGTDIDVLNGASNLAPTTTNPPPDGTFSASVIAESNITANVSYSLDPPSIVYGPPSGMLNNVASASITYKIDAAFNAQTYTFTKKQSFTKVSDGSSPIFFWLNPQTQTVAAGSDGSVPGTYQDVIISGSQGISTMVYNQSPTLGLGEYKITDVSGSVTIIDTTPATQVIQISAASQNTNVVAVDVAYNTFGGLSGSVRLYFTVIKGLAGTDGTAGADGTSGPGLLFRGLWTASVGYTSSISPGRRDAVLYTGSAGELNGYYMAEQTHINQEPSTSADTAFWSYLGDEQYFVAAEIAIFRESYIYNTLNIGTNSQTASANITLWGGNDYPYISIGQTAGQGYSKKGIWLGIDTGSAPQKLAKFSISGSNNGTGSGIFFDSTQFAISGSIFAQAGQFTGNVTVGSEGLVVIGPNAQPKDVSSQVVNTNESLEYVYWTSGSLKTPATMLIDPVADGYFTETDVTLDTTYYTTHSFACPVTAVEGERHKWQVSMSDFRPGGSTEGEGWEFETAYGYGGRGGTTVINQMYIKWGQNGTHFQSIAIGGGVPTYKYLETETIAPGNGQIDVYVMTNGYIDLALEDDFVGSGVTGQPLFTASATASTLQSSLAINSNGIFFDRGTGTAENIVNLVQLLSASVF